MTTGIVAATNGGKRGLRCSTMSRRGSDQGRFFVKMIGVALTTAFLSGVTWSYKSLLVSPIVAANESGGWAGVTTLLLAVVALITGTGAFIVNWRKQKSDDRHGYVNEALAALKAAGDASEARAKSAEEWNKRLRDRVDQVQGYLDETMAKLADSRAEVARLTKFTDEQASQLLAQAAQFRASMDRLVILEDQATLHRERIIELERQLAERSAS